MGGLHYARAVSGFNGGDPSKYPGAFPPPPGVTADLDNPQDAGRKGNIAGLVICLALATLLFAVRVQVKLRITRRLLLEDLACLTAWVMIVAVTATSAMMVHYGLGRHSWDVSVDNYSKMLKWLYVTSILYEPAAFFTKATLLLLLARIFSVHTSASRGIYAFIIMLLVTYIPLFAVKIALCSPIPAYWDPAVPGECLNLRKIFIIDVAFAIATDSIISIIPIPLVWNLRMSWRRKIKIVLMLGAGGVATAVTIYRLVKLISYIDSKDVASDFVLLDVLTVLELTIGLVCSCLPALNILIEYTRHTPSDANSPRSGFHRAIMGPDRHFTEGFTWHWLGTPRPTTSEKGGGIITRTTKVRNNTSNTQASTRTNFDTELAMLSGQDIGEMGHAVQEVGTGEEGYGRGSHVWFSSERVTACDGWREGWLDACAHNDQGRRNLTVSTAEHRESAGTDESKRSRDISERLAEMSGNQPWGYIWDGRSNRDGVGEQDADSRR